MGIIQKRADELKPGDVIPENSAHYQRVVVQIAPSGTYPAQIGVTMYARGSADVYTLEPDRVFDVESPDISPAQQHADELAQALKITVAALNGKDTADVDAMQDLLGRVLPPEPPTLAEALEALLAMVGQGGKAAQDLAAEILERARRSGLM